MQPGGFRVVLVVVVGAILASCMGCTNNYEVRPEPLTEWPSHEKLDMGVQLVLTPEFCNAKYEKSMMGDRYVYPLGPALANNAEAMARQAFREVKVDRASSATAGDMATLTPSVTHADLSFAMTVFEPVPMTCDVLWTLCDPQGRTLWAETVRGQCRHPLGNMYTHYSEARTRADKLMKDLFQKSLTTITTSPEFRRLAKPGNRGTPG